MKIRDLYRKGRIPVSFEIFPPKGELSVETLRSMLESMRDVRPDFISVTCSAGGTGSSKTAPLAGIIQNEYGIPAVAHLTCLNSRRAEVEERIEDIRSRGLENVLALRGDRVGSAEAADFRYAAELIACLKEKTDFCIGAGCYPEGHVECTEPEADLIHLKEKQDAGADFLISQLFFDNELFYRFVDRARRIGITLPIDAGIMPVMGKSQVTKMVFTCGASLPAPLVRLLCRYENSPDDLIRAGMEYAARQITELAASGAADGIHIYSMNKAEVARYEMDALKHAGF